MAKTTYMHCLCNSKISLLVKVKIGLYVSIYLPKYLGFENTLKCRLVGHVQSIITWMLLGGKLIDWC